MVVAVVAIDAERTVTEVLAPRTCAFNARQSQSPGVRATPVTVAAVAVERDTPPVPVWVPDWEPEVVIAVPARALATVVAMVKVPEAIEDGTT
jgi:hypothetical protein